MLDVGEQKLLVLLLVVQSKHDELNGVGITLPLRDKALHVVVDMVAVCEHFSNRGARQQTALGSPVHFADLVIIGIEQEPEDRVELPVACEALAQQEILEEPRCMSQVPLRRTDIRHALDNKVLRLERARQLECERARIAVTLRKFRVPG